MPYQHHYHRKDGDDAYLWQDAYAGALDAACAMMPDSRHFPSRWVVIVNPLISGIYSAWVYESLNNHADCIKDEPLP